LVAVARAEPLAAVLAVRPFDVYPGAAADQAHVIVAASALDAAMRFLEGWHSSLEDAGPVDISVVDRVNGAATRFDIDLD
jgi:hypothetical protein